MAVTKSFIDILEELEKITGTNDKIALIKKNATDLNLKEFLKYALDKNITFGISEIDETITAEKMFPKGGVYIRFIGITDALINRKLTGNNARLEIAMFLNMCSDLERKWYKKCLMKDLSSIGIGQRLFEEAYDEKGFKFRLMLAETEDNLEKVEDEAGYLDKKANGVRTIVTIEDGQVSAIYGGRNGLIADNFYFIQEELEILVSKKGVNLSVVFDGEVHVNDCLEDTMSLYGFKWRTKDHFIGKTNKLKQKAWDDYCADEERILKFKKDAKFVIFDTMTLGDWNAQKCDAKLEDRKKVLAFIKDAIEELGLKRIEVIETEIVANQQEACVAAQGWITRGFEGGIYKRNSGVYEWKRSRNSIKIKEEIDLDVRIVGFEIGKTKFNPDGTPKPDMLGKFLVVDARGVEFGIGTGHYLSEAKRIEIWNNQSDYLGKILQCKAQRGSKNSYACPRVEDVLWEADVIRVDRNDLE